MKSGKDIGKKIVASLSVLFAILIGIGVGLAIAGTSNVENTENWDEIAPALPTKLLDINGRLITEFAGDEKRELVSLNELPQHLINAALAREDPDFYHHRGFSVRGIMRAAFGIITGQSLGGGSTITQQVAGTLYADRSDYSIKRKLVELWYAIQMERRYSKNEILELYLNYMIMGPGVYGVEAASQYFFGHSARNISLGEAAVLVIQLSSPSRYNPLSNPNIAMDRQRSVLDRMVELGYISRAEAEASFTEYWDNYDYTRVATSAYYNREDKAPWFSEYVRRELDSLMYGSMDYYRDGYTVYTTLDLDAQDAAQKYVNQGIDRANRSYNAQQNVRLTDATQIWTPIAQLLSLTFNLTGIDQTAAGQNEYLARNRYTKTINPILDMGALLFGMQDLKVITNSAYADMKTSAAENQVEGALITLEQDSGYIKALVGGSHYDESNQLIRATQASVQPGSSFKPLYYSAAIDSRKFTPATLIYDTPTVFHNQDGTPYIPVNFNGTYIGQMLLYYALASSQNIASVKILDGIGFDAAIQRAAALLGINDEATIRRTFPRVYPLALGVISVAPIQMAKAFATFANQGQEVRPIAIRYIEDRNGKLVMDVEREIREEQRKKGDAIQIISPQNAAVMTNILRKTVEVGTLRNPSAQGSKFIFKDENGKSFTMPFAGKTGTPQNWSDAWTVGFSPYYTTAIWFGFDKPGNSLGVSLTGSTLAGYVWADYMRDIHQGLPFKEFTVPPSGIVEAKVCNYTGLLASSACPRQVSLFFLEGTQPTSYCNYHIPAAQKSSVASIVLPGQENLLFDANSLTSSLQMPSLDINKILNYNYTASTEQSTITENSGDSDSEANSNTDSDYGLSIPTYNPFMN
ncbi:MAG: PBP1A family penicillin-binding protein [Spirochaetaceae bacterium]|jgi:penicillin-binding protein 1A|nr:PBP1A family penicillin-binding protein [Spirochaetaceae bacterium]